MFSGLVRNRGVLREDDYARKAGDCDDNQGDNCCFCSHPQRCCLITINPGRRESLDARLRSVGHSREHHDKTGDTTISHESEP